MVFTWMLHEFTHWITSELLGYKAIMRLNSVSGIEGQNPTAWHQVYISAAGPLITIIQAITVFYLLQSRFWNKYLYTLLFTAFYMRLLAGLMNFINPNDEGRIGLFLEIGIFTLPLIVSGLLFYLVYTISKKYALNLRFHLWTTLIIMTISSILILTDQFVGINVL